MALLYNLEYMNYSTFPHRDILLVGKEIKFSGFIRFTWYQFLSDYNIFITIGVILNYLGS